ncbi:kinetochore protein mis14 [Pochonia chlamydosporia 170]|uniref:Kinetochore protein mis14 n=1 Tax=Pochonia chlamydosporia 170 TaxID=1380566 RepID=A0A179FLF7_METCM|nr:kinetochore protein mis14 [Pochonia chlamydosporia 170]OAQ66178.1 kinetochore protein mis14 [Pochonia chlamydosporia 170]
MDHDSITSQSQRKIELQSPEDLSYLIANVRNAATTLINQAFPQLPSQPHGEDDLRNQIESLVHEYINKTFGLAAPNLSINGLPISPADLTTTPETYEPFDARKRQRVADLIAQEEKLLEEVAALKRSVPAAAAAEQAARVRDAIRRDEEAVEGTEKAVVDKASEEAGLRVDTLERQDGVERGFREAVEVLGRLKRDMPSVVARMERARVAGEYVLDAK